MSDPTMFTRTEVFALLFGALLLGSLITLAWLDRPWKKRR